MKFRPDITRKGAAAYVTGDVKPFDQKDQMFLRSTWDPAWREAARRYYGYHEAGGAGYTVREGALNDAGWWVELAFGSGNFIGREGLGAWEAEQFSSHRVRKPIRPENPDAAELTKSVKRAARLYGASLAGVCRLDRRWLYSHSYHSLRKEHKPIEVPGEIQYAVVMAHEMDAEAIAQSPNLIGTAAASAVYSRMATTAGLLAQFIRGLGFKALPLGNDTAASVPLAIDAGLGELARPGWLITPQYGPRVRLNKVLTDMPLVPDRPIDFGVWDFCMSCRRCARQCPGQAISLGPPSDAIHNICNRPGVFRWPLDAEKCFAFMTRHDTDCGTCIRVCPFNKPPGPFHTAVRWGISHTRFLDRAFARADTMLGYGKQAPPERFWKG